MNYPKEKYQIVIHQHPEYLTTEVIAISSYAGKPVKGKAICHSNDEYDEQKGIDLAIARCAEKIAIKRYKRACKKAEEATRQLDEADMFFSSMLKYKFNAADELTQAEDEVERLLAEY